MATILAPQFGREVLRCNRCDLVQFATPKMFCRRCRQPYDWECAIEAEQTENSRNPESIPQTDSLRARIAYNVLNLRQLNGFTQRDVGLRMGVPRTYVSKIEGRKVTPNLSSLDRLARVLGTSVVALVSTPLDPGDKYPSECLRDPFLGQMSRFAGKLTPTQRTRVLDCARRPGIFWKFMLLNVSSAHGSETSVQPSPESALPVPRSQSQPKSTAARAG